MAGKVCATCKIEKSADCFPKRSDGSCRSWCYECCRIYDRKRRPRTTPINPLTGQDRLRDYQLRCNYNISLDEYNDLFERQSGCCGSCGKHQTELEITLCVDHDHDTGEVRGLLCKTCNSGLGLLGDTIESVENMLKYLKGEVSS